MFEQDASPTRTQGSRMFYLGIMRPGDAVPAWARQLMRIIAINAGIHDYIGRSLRRLRAALPRLSEERLTRIKGYGQTVPWLGIDEVLRIAGWARNDVDAIALTRGFHPTYHLRVPRGASCATRSIACAAPGATTATSRSSAAGSVPPTR